MYLYNFEELQITCSVARNTSIKKGDDLSHPLNACYDGDARQEASAISIEERRPM